MHLISRLAALSAIVGPNPRPTVATSLPPQQTLSRAIHRACGGWVKDNCYAGQEKINNEQQMWAKTPYNRDTPDR